MKSTISVVTTKKQGYKFIENMKTQGYEAVTVGNYTHFVLDGKVSADYSVYISTEPYAQAFIGIRPI